ncbi:MAG: DegT/DnrJ/EryC1/StrS family aminotransferase [bacterium]
MPGQFFNITRQNQALEAEINEAINKVVKSGHYILGENVAALEKEFAAENKTKLAIGVASGTDALHLALLACGVKEGDEVITSPFTFVATAEAIVYCGAKPVFADIDPKTFNIDASQIGARVTGKTKAILPVHLFGQACEMDKIMAIAKQHNLKVVEDCAQAFGAEFNGQPVGSFGDAGAHSFFPTKNLGCFGDGGMISTNDEALANELKVLRAHGSRQTYHHDIIGFNSRLDELQAAILRIKLPHVKDYIAARRKNAAAYFAQLKNLAGATPPFEHPSGKHTYNQFTLRSANRDNVVAALKGQNIGAMIYYPLSLHLQKAFDCLGYKKGDFPVAEAAQTEVFSLPVYPELKPEELSTVCGALLSC